MESFWFALKRGHDGVYHPFSPKPPPPRIDATPETIAGGVLNAKRPARFGDAPTRTLGTTPAVAAGGGRVLAHDPVDRRADRPPRPAGGEKPSSLHETQADAIERARELARNQSSELFIHRPDGRIPGEGLPRQ